MYLYNRKPVALEQVKTPYRNIQTSLPVPQSIPILQVLEKYEPQSMLGQPPIVVEEAEGFQIYDKWGNVWLDWSSGVLITNTGHAHPDIIEALKRQVDKKLIATYVFNHESRAELVKMLADSAPEGLDKVFLLTTGSEATENTIKLARTYGIKKGGRKKHIIISYENAFHGRTLGAQLAGGCLEQKEWIVNYDPGFVNVPFPDGFFNENTQFELLLESLEKQGVNPKNIAGVITETYQGCGPFFMPVEYAKRLEAFCRENDALLIFDEVQAGFCRTGKWFGFEHYGVTPDLIACGKGMSSSLPIAAVIGRDDVMNLYKPGSMTSTHSGSPLPVIAAIANIKAMKTENIVEHVVNMGHILKESLEHIQQKHPSQIGFATCKGMVAGLQIVQPGTKNPDGKSALAINEKCFQKGLLMFAPVGKGGMCIKICPPLITPRDALEEGITVLDEVCDEVLD